MRKAATELHEQLSKVEFDYRRAKRTTEWQRFTLIKKALSGFYLDEGRHREVFEVNGNYVVKVPCHKDGKYDNLREWKRFRRRQKSGKRWNSPIEFAKCCLVDVAGSKILVMERLRDVNTPNDNAPNSWPDWVDHIDSSQCGFNNAGQLVAFDYGDEDDDL
jgi:hypothetical protein